ncbi:MAG: hypothetical protein HS128_21355 [Ideonella sp.]|nr:hypothetical protein [Ideonella sp.]MCC7457371.1 hypothetical protein [Nitrospira sp.]
MTLHSTLTAHRAGPRARSIGSLIDLARSPLLAMLVALALLGGCATPTTAPSEGGQPPLRPGQPAPNALAAEVQWMQQLFDGTPVTVASDADGAMRVDVPLAYAFDARSPAPKPPLRAVMDKVAISLARQASAKVQVAAPGPSTRSAAMRSYLLGRGVIGLRVSVAQPLADAVTLRVVPGPTAINQLDDRTLPPPTNAFPAKRKPPA